jgi:glycosyltransferase involved in cell wall biosynthesis
VRVLHLAAGNLFGGVETYLLTLARLRHHCPVVEPHFGVCFPGRLRDELDAAEVPVHDLGAVRVSRPWTVLRGRNRLKSIIRDHGIEAVITHGCWPHAVFAPAVRRTSARLVNFIHDSLTRKHWINRWSARTPPDRVIANSRFTAGTAGRVFPGVAVEVHYLPVAAPVVENRDFVRGQVRVELETPLDAVVVLQASRLERWKGQAVLVECLGRLKDSPGWVAWIAGGPQKAGEAEFLAELKAAVVQFGIADRVYYLGQRSDVSRLMTAADIYCQPNTGPEPFGVAFIEALYAKLPVVTSDFGGAKEIVTDSCGVLCPPGDAEAVTAVMRELIADAARRHALGDTGPARAGELCDPARQIAKLAGVLRSPVGASA